MKYIISLIVAGIGVLLAAYVGIHVMLYGGIVDVIEAIKTDPLNGHLLAWGIIKIVLCEAAGFIALPFVFIAKLISTN